MNEIAQERIVRLICLLAVAGFFGGLGYNSLVFGFKWVHPIIPGLTPTLAATIGLLSPLGGTILLLFAIVIFRITEAFSGK